MFHVKHFGTIDGREHHIFARREHCLFGRTLLSGLRCGRWVAPARKISWSCGPRIAQIKKPLTGPHSWDHESLDLRCNLACPWPARIKPLLAASVSAVCVVQAKRHIHSVRRRLDFVHAGAPHGHRHLIVHRLMWASKIVKGPAQAPISKYGCTDPMAAAGPPCMIFTC